MSPDRFVKNTGVRGSIEAIKGPMFCGKSEELIRRVRIVQVAIDHMLRNGVVTQEQAGELMRVFKPALDNRRGETTINTYNGTVWPAISVDSSREILKYITPFTAIVAVDEAQFFDGELTWVLNGFANSGGRVIVAGLGTNFRGDTFGPMGDILASAGEITALYAICQNCGNDQATQTQRIINGEPARYSDPIVLVGGSESYEARCRKCHNVPGRPPVET